MPIPRIVAVLTLALALGAPSARAAADMELTLTIEGHRFTPEELRVKAGSPFHLVITNKDATAEEFESRELRLEKVIPAGKAVRLRMPPLRPGVYPFTGEYHEATAKGRIIAE